MKKSDYEDLCGKVLKGVNITIEDYYDIKSDRDYYERKYNEYFSEYLSSDSRNYSLLVWFSILIPLLIISIVLNFALYFS